VFEIRFEKVTGRKRELRSEELHFLCRLTNKIGVIKSRKMRWARHVARVEENSVNILVGNERERENLGEIFLIC
jgi:hypothetical protein